MKGQNKNSIPDVTKTTNNHSKWLKIAGISGSIVLIFTILFSFLYIYIPKIKLPMTTNIYITYIQALGSLILFILFYYGFFVLGKIYNKKLLKVTSLLLIIFAILMTLYSLLKQLIIGDSVIDVGSFWIAALIIGPILVVSGISGILKILFGVGIIKLKEHIKYARIVGILYFVSLFVYWSTSGLSFLFLPGGASAARIASLIYVPYNIVRGLSIVVLYLSLIVLLFKASKQK